MMTTVDDKPHELTAIALQRAKMCELLGKAQGEKQPESYFLIGLLSVLDAMMDISMAQVIESLSLTRELSDALVHRKGKLGLVLSSVIGADDGNWDGVAGLGLSPEVWQNTYFESVKWSNVIMNEVHAA